MRMKSLTKSVAALAFIGAVTVYAQTPPADPAPKKPAAPVAKVLTIADMTTQLSALETQVKEDTQHMRYLQDVARKEKDVVKLTCVNDKLIELKPQQNMFQNATQQFGLLKDGTAEAARPSYDEASATAASIKDLRGATEACVGVPELYKQESDVTVEHPDFPDDPTTTDPFTPEIEPPAYASPFS